LWLHQREPEVLAENARHVPGSGRRADPDPCWPRESGGANCESQTAGPRGRDHVGMQSHSRPKVEIESLQSQHRPDADVYQPDSGNCAMAHGRGLDPRSHAVLEHGSQHQRGYAYDQRRGDRYKPPPSPAGSKRKHPRKDATAGSRADCRAPSCRWAMRSASIGPLNIGAAVRLREGAVGPQAIGDSDLRSEAVGSCVSLVSSRPNDFMGS